jgi:CBS domain-containing protein
MTQAVKGLAPEATALEALQVLTELKISGLPVIDKSNKLVGMFTEKEILAHILPKYFEQVGAFAYADNPKAVKQKIKNFASLKVEDIMRREVISVEENTALCEAAHIMLVNKARRLPVLNAAKQVVGIASRGDIVKALFQESA